MSESVLIEDTVFADLSPNMHSSYKNLDVQVNTDTFEHKN